MAAAVFFLACLLLAPALAGLAAAAVWLARRVRRPRCPRCGSGRVEYVANWECDLYDCRDCGHCFCHPE